MITHSHKALFGGFCNVENYAGPWGTWDVSNIIFLERNERYNTNGKDWDKRFSLHLRIIPSPDHFPLKKFLPITIPNPQRVHRFSLIPHHSSPAPPQVPNTSWNNSRTKIISAEMECGSGDLTRQRRKRGEERKKEEQITPWLAAIVSLDRTN